MAVANAYQFFFLFQNSAGRSYRCWWGYRDPLMLSLARRCWKQLIEFGTRKGVANLKQQTSTNTMKAQYHDDSEIGVFSHAFKATCYHPRFVFQEQMEAVCDTWPALEIWASTTYILYIHIGHPTRDVQKTGRMLLICYRLRARYRRKLKEHPSTADVDEFQ